MDTAKKSYDIPKFKEQYENFIGGEYFDVISPVEGKVFTRGALDAFRQRRLLFQKLILVNFRCYFVGEQIQFFPQIANQFCVSLVIAS